MEMKRFLKENGFSVLGAALMIVGAVLVLTLDNRTLGIVWLLVGVVVMASGKKNKSTKMDKNNEI